MPLQKRHEAAIEFEFVMVFPPITGSPLRNPKKPQSPPSQGLLLCAPFGGPAIADVMPHSNSLAIRRNIRPTRPLFITHIPKSDPHGAGN